MAVASKMNQENHQHDNQDHENKDDDDEHDQDMVMPGFRFHPTEEELVEFYLRRKVEGKRFNVDLITFLDLYRYDPWELPALAAIGEKEWFFYVPRDRKYRNGDRPNRVTTSGYWKATGADRMIRTDNLRSIGLKKTLVFYSGKAPKGIRTSWIMNEYRLPHHETARLQKAEISLCRVYKRPGVEDHPSIPRSFHTRASSSRTDKKRQHPTHTSLEKVLQTQQSDDKFSDQTSGNSTTNTEVGTALGLSNLNNSYNLPLDPFNTSTISPPNCNIYSASSIMPMPNGIDELHRLISFQQASVNQHDQQVYHNNNPNINLLSGHDFSITNIVQQPVVPQSQSLTFSMLPGGSVHPAAAFPERLWEWSSIPEAAARKNYNDGPFK